MFFPVFLRVLVVAGVFMPVFAAAGPLKIIAFGDSLTAGYGLASTDGFSVQLDAAVKGRGFDVDIINAGVSGDTTSGGRARLDWSLGNQADGVIMALGGNDMLRGISPLLVRENLEAMLQSLQARALPVLLVGMRASPNLGAVYEQEFNAIFPELAAKYDVLFYPFFLEGVAAEALLNQPDGIHPSAEGVARIIEKIFPSVEALIRQAENR